MAAILNSAILNLAILYSATLVFPLKLTHTCPDWFPPFAQKKLHSFILTQLNDGSHLEFYHVGLRKFHSFIVTQLDDGSHLEFCYLDFGLLGFSILVFPLKLTHTCQDWFPPFAQKNLHSFILTQLDDGSHLEFYYVGLRQCHLGFRHLVFFSQIHSKTLSLHSDSDSN